jgi:hypothetical protein
MTDTTATPRVGGPIQAAALDMLRSVLMALGTTGAFAAMFTSSQWLSIVGGVMAIASGVWSWVAAHPSRTSPLRAVQALVKAGGQAKSWDADTQALEAAILPIVERAVDAQIRTRAGILAGPADALANRTLQSAAGTAAGHLEI